jgi:hypothetical protein
MTKKTSHRYSSESWERAVRMVLEHGSDHASQWATIGSIASVWRQLCRDGTSVARCTVARLMRQMCLRGVVGAGKPGPRWPTRRCRARLTG